jgi:hypothetical protein
MGNLYEYFAASDDAAAAAVVHGGAQAAGLDSLGGLKGADPVILLATLEALLRGVDYEVVSTTPRHCDLLAESSEDGPWVVTLTDTLRDALAGASEATLSEVAVPWSKADEFRDGPPDLVALLADFLGRLAALARTAAARDDSLYCWMSL